MTPEPSSDSVIPDSDKWDTDKATAGVFLSSVQDAAERHERHRFVLFTGTARTRNAIAFTSTRHLHLDRFDMID
mgnify:CR=1 FL=1